MCPRPLRGPFLSSCCGLALYACSADVLLGGECPGNEQRCVFPAGDADVVDAGTRTDASAATDARRPDAQPPNRPDAQEPEPERDADAAEPDPVRDSGPPNVIEDPNGIIDRLENLSFELAPGSQPGDVAVINLPLQPSQTSIDPWYTCQILGTGMTNALSGVRAESEVPLTSPSQATLEASADDTFLSIQYQLLFLPLPVIQKLEPALPAGSHVRFAIDACSNDATAPLSMHVLGGAENDFCFTDMREPRTILATKTVNGTTWQTLCFDFVTPTEIRYLGLVPGLTSGVDGHRLFLDNMRSTDECPSD